MAQFLREQGDQAYALEGGLDAWLDQGYPTEAKEAERGRSVQDVCPECGQAAHTHRRRT